MTYADIARFHGHKCPGLAIGYRMASAGLEALDSARAEDEELVSIVDNNACGVDALQCLTGCTFGKGNLLFRDHGKQVYTIYSRTTRKGVRIVFHGHGMPDGIRDDRDAYAKWILSAPQESVLSVTPVSVQEPEPARIMKSVLCKLCGEAVMESRVRDVDGMPVCIPCFDKHQSVEHGTD
ncbi:MAG: FmdE family protein [Syntrophales bacterium]|nr:FmdE family protein [Syntrophales bacterium]